MNEGTQGHVFRTYRPQMVAEMTSRAWCSRPASGCGFWLRANAPALASASFSWLPFPACDAACWLPKCTHCLHRCKREGKEGTPGSFILPFGPAPCWRCLPPASHRQVLWYERRVREDLITTNTPRTHCLRLWVGCDLHSKQFNLNY